MKRATASLLLLLTGIFSSTLTATDQTRKQAFAQLLLDSGLYLEQRQNYSDVPIHANPLVPYEHAMRHESGMLELRFIVRPLSQIEIDYVDPHSAAPEPNHLFPLLFESITNQLALGSDMPSNTFPEYAAQESFNANWAAAAVFDLDPRFSTEFSNAFLVGMHKNQLADAYTLFLYNDHELAKPLIKEALSIMSFSD